MFKARIFVGAQTDTEVEVARLMRLAKSKGLGGSQIGELEYALREAIQMLVSAAVKLSSQGSQMSATKVVSGDGFQIEVVGRQGGHLSVVEWLKSKLGSQ